MPRYLRRLMRDRLRRKSNLRIKLPPALVTKICVFRQDRITEWAIRQQPQSAVFAESGIGAIFSLAIGAGKGRHRIVKLYNGFAPAGSKK